MLARVGAMQWEDSKIDIYGHKQNPFEVNYPIQSADALYMWLVVKCTVVQCNFAT